MKTNQFRALTLNQPLYLALTLQEAIFLCPNYVRAKYQIKQDSCYTQEPAEIVQTGQP